MVEVEDKELIAERGNRKLGLEEELKGTLSKPTVPPPQSLNHTLSHYAV